MSLCSNSECSETESGARTEGIYGVETRYRVRVCLRRYYTDERARCYVSVSPRQPVRWLERRLRALFALSGNFCLRSRGHLLPSRELLSLLHPDDPVEVLPLTSNRISSTQSEKTLDTVCDPPALASLDAVDGNNQINAEKKHSENVTSDTRIDWVTVEDGHFHSEKDTENNLESLKQKALALIEDKYSQVSQNEQQDSMLFLEDSACEEPIKKRKRVRQRKRKNKLPLESGEDCALTVVSCNSTEDLNEENVQRNSTVEHKRSPRIVQALTL